MKKTFMAMLLAGSTMTMFAQTTQPSSTSPTTNPQPSTTTPQPSTTTPQSPNTTQQSAGVTGDPSSQTGNNVSNMSNTATNGTTTNNASANGTWNGVSTNTTPYTSTSWTPESDPSWAWNNYGVWNSSANWNSNPNASSVYGSNNMGNTSMNNGNTNTDASMNSTGSYNAYSGTAIAGLPANVQMRFGQDFPMGVNNQYTWHQYGDWFHTHYMNNGRLIQYFYDQRGAGYSLALPVLQTYVPENIVASALNKFGSRLYSIAMVKTADGNDAYQIGLLQRGQMMMHHLDENGASVANVWRVDSVDSAGTMISTGTNAAMDANMTNGTTNTQMSDQSSSTNSVDGTTNGTTNGDKTKVKDGKIEIEHADGTETKVKWEDDKMKIKDKNGKTKIKKS
jgi:hypothetical protein